MSTRCSETYYRKTALVSVFGIPLWYTSNSPRTVIQVNILAILYGPRCEKPCHQDFANNTGADQPAHPGSLISAFVIRFLESFILKLATGEISIF